MSSEDDAMSQSIMSTVNEVNALDVIERDWPPIPDEIKHLAMKRAEDGSHIICSACEMFDSRKQSQNGKVICTRKGRPFQYGMMKDHVYNEFHKESIKRFIMNKDGIFGRKRFQKEVWPQVSKVQESNEHDKLLCKVDKERHSCFF